MTSTRHPTAILLAVACWLVTAPAMKAAAEWKHGPSPCRGIYKIDSPPSRPEAGYFLEVPVCGLGDPDGRGVFVFDGKGQKLLVQALGPGHANAALVIAAGRHVEGPLTAYWGSRFLAPQATRGFVPGLTVDIRSVPPGANISTWEHSQRLLQNARRIGILPVNTVELAYNPIDSADAFAMVFQGTLELAQEETWTLFLASDDAGYVEVGGELVIQRNGSHSPRDAVRGQGRKAVKLSKGLTPIRCSVIDTGGAQMAVLARYEDPRRKYVVPAAAFVRSGRTALQRVEANAAKGGCPVFRVALNSYIGVNGLLLHEVELSTYTGEPAAWHLGNGLAGHGKQFSCIVSGTEPISVDATVADGLSAKGRIDFPEAPVPRQHKWEQHKAYSRYVQLILAPDLRRVAAPTLAAYLSFANLHERNRDAAPIALALLSRRDLRDEEGRREALLSLARTAPETALARKAYRALLNGTRSKETPVIALEYLDFELYRCHDLEVVKTVLPQVAAVVGEKEPVLLLYRTEAALYGGDPDRASAGIAALQRRIAGDSRSAAARGNAARETAETEINDAFYAGAEQHLREWAVLIPEALNTGQYALVRARLLQRYGWHEGALMVLQAVQKLNPLPPFLPELELQQAVTQQALKRADEARGIFQHIVSDYPNHPVAREAARRLKALP